MSIDAVMMTWAFGLVTGMRHAFEPDHVAAMSTLVTEGHGSRRTAWLGAWWGLGHTAALLAVGVALGAMRAELSPSVARALESAVLAALFGLGSVAAMAALSGLAGWHLTRFASRPVLRAWLHVAAGALSLVVGLLSARLILPG